MAKPVWRKRSALSPARQLAGLQTRYPTGKGSVKHDVLSWNLTAKPSPFSLEYLIEVMYRPGVKPKLYVSGGEIELLDDLSGIPHKYAVDDDKKRVQVCLDYGEWRRDDPLATTMIPWAIEWLAYFEIWLVTGEWTGGGIHNGIFEE